MSVFEVDDEGLIARQWNIELVPVGLPYSVAATAS
jgi:hypothetical protein